MPDDFEEFERELAGLGDDDMTFRQVDGGHGECMFSSIQHGLLHALYDIGLTGTTAGMYMKRDGQSFTVMLKGADVYMKMQWPQDRINEAKEHLRRHGLLDPGDEPCGP